MYFFWVESMHKIPSVVHCSEHLHPLDLGCSSASVIFAPQSALLEMPYADSVLESAWRVGRVLVRTRPLIRHLNNSRNQNIRQCTRIYQHSEDLQMLKTIPVQLLTVPCQGSQLRDEENEKKNLTQYQGCWNQGSEVLSNPVKTSDVWKSRMSRINSSTILESSCVNDLRRSTMEVSVSPDS